MGNLKNGPQGLIPLLALVWRVFGVLHLVGELEECVFDVVEAIWWRFAVAGAANRRHSGVLSEYQRPFVGVAVWRSEVGV
jgi:hypothetical protein